MEEKSAKFQKGIDNQIVISLCVDSVNLKAIFQTLRRSQCLSASTRIRGQFKRKRPQLNSPQCWHFRCFFVTLHVYSIRHAIYTVPDAHSYVKVPDSVVAFGAGTFFVLSHYITHTAHSPTLMPLTHTWRKVIFAIKRHIST